MSRPTNLTMCSFCGKSHAEVRKLIAGVGVYICDECVVVCKRMIDKELGPHGPRASVKLDVPKPAEIKRMLDQYVVGQEDAKKSLAVAVRNHYKRIQQQLQPGPAGEGEPHDKVPVPMRHAHHDVQ